MLSLYLYAREVFIFISKYKMLRQALIFFCVSLLISEEICVKRRFQFHTSSGSFTKFSLYSLSARRERLTPSNDVYAAFFTRSVSNSSYAVTLFALTLKITQQFNSSRNIQKKTFSLLK